MFDGHDDGSKVQVCFLFRSTFTLSDFCLKISAGKSECISLNIVAQDFRESFNYFPMHVHIKSEISLAPASALVFSIMVELAFYPAVALIYFFGVMKASQDDLVELDDRASMNVFCLFVLAQPLCLLLGGYTGMAAYLLTALISYNFLPWRQTKQPAKGKESKKKK